LLILTTAAALGLGLAAPVGAQAPTQSITASYSAATRELIVTGDARDNTIVIGRDAAGRLLVNGGAVPIGGGAPTVDLVARVQVTGLAGHDKLSLNEANGALPPAHLLGDTGNDTLTGGSRADLLDGGDGNDILDGNGGDDTALMGAGDDLYAWDPGEGSDTVEGQADQDTLRVNGSASDEIVDLAANGQRLRFFRNIANIVMDLDDVERVVYNAHGGADTIAVNDLTGTDAAAITLNLEATPGGGAGDGRADAVIVSGTAGRDAITVGGAASGVNVRGAKAAVKIVGGEAALDQLAVNALAGADRVDASGLPGGLIALAVDGGAGDDVILGGAGADVLLGGADQDAVDGNGGADVVFLGAGDDSFTWEPGDGSDTVEGQAGTDTLLFTGSASNEIVDLSANGRRTRLTRNIANIVMDIDGVEQIEHRALGGADTITVNSLIGTAVTAVAFNLAGAPGSAAGDGQGDAVIVNGTAGDDVVFVVGGAGAAAVTGLSVRITMHAAEGARDTLRVNTLAGDDVAEASALAAGVLGLLLDGGADDDALIGSARVDQILGGPGDDVLLGGPGADLLDGGAGDNIVIQD
jgi:Ca2+-binding RTX toxin-like protein